MKNKRLIIYTLLLVGIIFLTGCGNPPNVNSEIIPTGYVGLNIGDTAPDFSINDVNGNSYSLSQFKDKPVVIAFFATWCTPCIIEANNVKEMDDELGGDKFEVFQIGVDDRENINDLKQFKDQYGDQDWIFGFGFDVANLYNVVALDTTIIVDKDGIIVYRDNGFPADINTLRRYLE